jgi:hypothetical protein
VKVGGLLRAADVEWIEGGLTEGEVDMLMRRFDRDGKGVISVMDFVNFVELNDKGVIDIGGGKRMRELTRQLRLVLLQRIGLVSNHNLIGPMLTSPMRSRARNEARRRMGKVSKVSEGPMETGNAGGESTAAAGHAGEGAQGTSISPTGGAITGGAITPRGGADAKGSSGEGSPTAGSAGDPAKASLPYLMRPSADIERDVVAAVATVRYTPQLLP